MTPHDTLREAFGRVCQRQDALNTIMAAKSLMHWAAAATEDEKHSAQGYTLDADNNVTAVFTDYRAAALDEAFELFRSGVPFKWWGKPGAQQFDRDNCVVECVDILHFLISEALRVQSAGYPLTAGEPLPDAVIRDSAHYAVNNVLDGYAYPRRYLKSAAFNLIRVLTGESISAAFFHFGTVIAALGITPEELTGLYFLKATLNTFRTEQFGLGVGYSKIWRDGREDNAHLFEFALRERAATGKLPDEAACMDFLTRTWAVQ